MAQPVKITILGDASNLQRALGSTSRDLDSFAGKAGQAGDKMAAFGKKASIFATLPIAALMGKAAQSASNLEQSVGAVESVFGDASTRIHAFGETADEAAGLSKREVNEMAAVIGASLKGMGFDVDAAADRVVTLEERAADMAATFGGTTQEAIEAMASALRGERDPIERYGVSIKQVDVNARIAAEGLDVSTTAAEKKSTAIATLDMLLEQTADTEGQFAREADSVAGAQARARAEMENASAELGNHLTPILKNAFEVAGNFARAVGDAPPELQKMALGGLAVVAALGPLSTLAGNATKAVGALAKATTFLATSQSTAALAASGLGAAVIGAVTIYGAYQAILGAAQRDQKNFDDSMASVVNTSALMGSAVNATKLEVKEAAVEAFIGATRWGQNADAMEQARANAEQLAPQIKAARETLQQMSEASGVSKERIAQLADELGVNLGAMSDEAREKLAGAVTQISEAVTPTERLDQVTEELGNEFSTTSEEVDAFAEALDALLGSQISAEEAQIRLREKTRELAAAIAEGRKEDESAAAFKDRLALETIGVVEAVLREEDALVKSGAASSDAEERQERLRAKLVEVKEQFPQLGGQIDGYIGKLDKIPDGKKTVVTLEFARKAAEDLWGPMGDGPGRGRLGSAAATVRQAMAGIPGLYVTSSYRTPAQNRAAGGSPTSYHMDRNNPAVDVGGSARSLDLLHRRLSSIGGRELIWRAPGHYDHLHYAHDGEHLTSSSPGWMPGLNRDERLRVLQTGETVLPRGGQAAIHIEHYHGTKSMAEEMRYAELLYGRIA